MSDQMSPGANRTSRGSSAPMRDIRPPPNSTCSTGTTWPRVRRVSRSHSTSRRRPATTRTMSLPVERSARWACRSPISETRAPFRGHSARRHEHLHDHQCHSAVAAGALRGSGRGAGHPAPRPARHHSERHRQGIPLARDLCVPARPSMQTDEGRHSLRYARDPEVGPDECLLLPPAGSGGDTGAGGRLLRSRPPRGGARTVRSLRSKWTTALFTDVVGRHLVLRECRNALHLRKSARCARSRSSGSEITLGSATASPTRASEDASVTACR